MNVGITRCATTPLSTQLRSVVLAALAAFALLIAAIGFVTPVPAQAAASARLTAPQVRLVVWRFALQQKGKPYVYGGTGPRGFDCSGLVYAAYRAARITLPRTTYAMLASWRLVRIPKSQAQQGDLAFFGTGHVEIFDHGAWTFGAADSGTRIGFHLMNPFWHPTMYFRIRM